MFNYIKQHKILSLIVFLNVVAILVVILIAVIHNSKTATIDVLVTPSDATIELNGVSYENIKSHNITPGNYHVVISMAGMQTKEYDIELLDNGFERIWNYLLDEDGGFTYYLNHPEDAALLNEVADEKAKAFLKEYNKLTSIMEVLPLTYSNTYEENATEIVSISIRWGSDDECKEKPFCLIVKDYTGKNTNKALEMIRDAGYNPDDYEIIFKEGEDE